MARALVRRVIKSRLARRQVAREASAHPAPRPGSIEVAVYFADAAVNMYQLRQWYAPLTELAKSHPVAIITRTASATLAAWSETDLPVVSARSVKDLERFVADQPLRMVLYVNQNAKNFQMFRYGRMWHVYINHGESDKMYMTTNQFKAYDYALVAGQAARDRLAANLWDYDIDRRTIDIGRPQVDHFVAPARADDSRVIVLYAPTWEGDRPAAAYGSVASHGEALVSTLLASGRHRLIYRPHPRTGVLDPQHKKAHERIVAAINQANTADPEARHLYDDGGELGWQIAAADVAITDISAMVYDRLSVGKPLLVTRPTSAAADVDERGYLGAAQWLDSDDVGRVAELADIALVDETARSTLSRWATHHFGDTTPGSATARFHAAIDELSARWSEESARHAESYPEDDDDDDSDGESFDED